MAKKNGSCLGTGSESRARQTLNMPVKHALLVAVWDTLSPPLTREKGRGWPSAKGLNASGLSEIWCQDPHGGTRKEAGKERTPGHLQRPE